MKTFQHAGVRTLSTAVLASLFLAGCGGGGSSGGGAASTPSAPSGTTPGGNDPGPGGNNGNGETSTSLRPVVYIADQDVADTYELYMSSPNAPGASIKLNAPMVAGAEVDSVQVLPSGDAAVYVADQNIYGRYELFLSRFANAGVPVQLGTPMPANRDVYDFIVSPDGTRVVYRADTAAFEQAELYMVDIANPNIVVKLSAPLVPGGSVQNNYVFSSDGTRLVYRADQEVLGKYELFMVTVAAPGQSQKVNAALVSGGNVYDDFTFSPDGTQIAYVADQMVDQKLELFNVAVSAPGVATRLNGQMIANGDVCHFKFSPDSSRVAYCADQQTDGVVELYTTVLSQPGVSIRLNPALVAGGQVSAEYKFSADGGFIVYRASQDVAGRDELYRVDIAAPGVATKLNAPLVADGDVGGFGFSFDGTRISYLATQETASVWELYEVALATPAVTAKLSDTMHANGVYWFDYEDDDTLVYMADQEGATTQLYRVTRAAPGDSTRLNGNLVTAGSVWSYRLVP